MTIVERPLSVQQRAMLDFIGTRTDDYYLNVEVFLVSGPLDVAALRQALSAAVGRHETIRSTFPRDRDIYRVLPAADELVDGVWRVDDGVTSVVENIRNVSASSFACVQSCRARALSIGARHAGVVVELSNS